MLDYSQYACPVCHGILHGSEDVAVCPVCGAPHHRACFRAAGACAYASMHGTARQWVSALAKDDENTIVCGNCGTVNTIQQVQCEKCGHVLREPLPPRPSEQYPPVDDGVFYSQFSPYIGIAPDSLMEGQPVMEVATFLGENAGYYLSRFHFMHMQKNHASWNWASALFPVEWFLYRKMYVPFLLSLLFSLLLLIPNLWVAGILMQDPTALQQLLATGAIPLTDISGGWLLAVNIAATLRFILRTVIATRANYIYRRHTMRSIAAVKTHEEDLPHLREHLAQKGGVSLWPVMILVAVCALAMVSVLIIL